VLLSTDANQQFINYQDLSVGILSERRSLAPPGLKGGHDGARGRNILIRTNGREIFMGGKNMFRVSKGDRFRIESPGGAGYGVPESK
jgi:5-oxoprolinase (ATP-hydrolysing)